MPPEVSPAPPPAPEPDEPEPMPNSERCYFCGQMVYVVERVSAEGKFFHRSCFTCFQCSITLRHGGYTFDQNTGEHADKMLVRGETTHRSTVSLLSYLSALVFLLCSWVEAISFRTSQWNVLLYSVNIWVLVWLVFQEVRFMCMWLYGDD